MARVGKCSGKTVANGHIWEYPNEIPIPNVCTNNNKMLTINNINIKWDYRNGIFNIVDIFWGPERSWNCLVLVSHVLLMTNLRLQFNQQLTESCPRLSPKMFGDVITACQCDMIEPIWYPPATYEHYEPYAATQKAAPTAILHGSTWIYREAPTNSGKNNDDSNHWLTHRSSIPLKTPRTPGGNDWL